MTAVPSPGLRERILAAAQGKQRITWWPPVFSWHRAAWAAVGIIAVIESSRWFLLARRSVAPQSGTQEIAQLTEEARQWRERADTAERLLAARKDAAGASAPLAPAPAAPQNPAAPHNDAALEQQLAAAMQEVRGISDALNAERARVVRLQADADSQRASAAALSAEKDQLEKRLSDAASLRTRLAEKDTQIASLTGQIQRLERDNLAFRNAINNLERQVDRGTRLVAMLSSPSVKLVKLQPTEAGGKSSGRAFVVEGEKLVFYASNLPALPAGRAYQLWLLRGRKPAIVSGGVFTARAQGTPLEFDNGSVVSDLRGLAITEEPDGGSPGPTGHKIMVGTVGSL